MSRTLNNLAVVHSHEIAEIRSYPETTTRNRSLKRMYQECIDCVREAIEIYDEEALYQRNMEYFQSELDEIEVWLSLHDFLPDNEGEDDDEDYEEEDDLYD